MKNDRILSSPLRPANDGLARHHLRHLVYSAVVFALCVAADVVVVEHLRHQPRRVRWQDGEVDRQFRPWSQPMPTNAVKWGVCDDGTVVWKEMRYKQ